MATHDRRNDTAPPIRPGKLAGPGVRARGARGLTAVFVRVSILAAFALAFGSAAVESFAPRSRAAETPSRPAAGSGPGPGRFTFVRRSVAQDQGAWVIDYQLRHAGQAGLILAPSDVGARLEGWVSNSRVGSHAVPRLARVTVCGNSGGAGTGDVIASSDESQRCRERVIVSVWADDGPLPESEPASLVSLAPGATAHVRLRLEHQHVLYGDYDPLLGVQEVELTLGSATLRDRVALDREHYLAQPKYAWPEPPEDRRDTRHFVSAPDSLHLESHIPGHQYYRYPERPVRYGSKLRLRFWYLIAAGTEGECRIRLAQYKDTPTSWRVLSGGGFEQVLETVGRWTKVERIVRAECEATTMALDFRIISETGVGEMWIDDVCLEPVGCAAASEKP
jgi:hypothetical protein